MARQLAQSLAEEAPRLLGEIRGALTAGDAVAVRRGAHTLKGSASVFEARHVMAAAQRLEDAARAGLLDNGGALLSELETEVARMNDAIRRLNSH
jgi:HPt (histidine-containing phosphotransfer) domain-containing protein